jgi:hypothetical protein
LLKQQHADAVCFARVSQALQLATQQDLQAYKPNELATLIAAFGALGVLDPRVLRSAVARSAAALDGMSTRPLAAVLHALVKVGYPVRPEWMAAYRTTLEARLAGCDERSLYAVVVAMPFAGCPQPASLLRKLEACLLGRFDAFTTQQLVALSSALYQMGHAPSDVYIRTFCAALAGGSWRLLGVREAAGTVQLLAGYAAASAAPALPDRAAGALAQHVLVPQLAACSMEDVCTLLSAAALRCACIPANPHAAEGDGSSSSSSSRPGWVTFLLPRALAACRVQLQDGTNPWLTLQALSAVARLGARPSMAFTERLLTVLFLAMHMLGANALLGVLKDLVAIGVRPSWKWMAQYWEELAGELEGGCDLDVLVDLVAFVTEAGVVMPAGVHNIVTARLEAATDGA